MKAVFGKLHSPEQGNIVLRCWQRMPGHSTAAGDDAMHDPPPAGQLKQTPLLLNTGYARLFYIN